jgi:hypothetical protein
VSDQIGRSFYTLDADSNATRLYVLRWDKGRGMFLVAQELPDALGRLHWFASHEVEFALSHDQNRMKKLAKLQRKARSLTVEIEAAFSAPTIEEPW